MQRNYVSRPWVVATLIIFAFSLTWVATRLSYPGVAVAQGPVIQSPRIQVTTNYVVTQINGAPAPQALRTVNITVFANDGVQTLEIRGGVNVVPNLNAIQVIQLPIDTAIPVVVTGGVGNHTLIVNPNEDTDIYWLWATGLDPDFDQPVPLIIERQWHEDIDNNHEVTVHYCVDFFDALWAQNRGAFFDGDGQDLDGDGIGDGWNSAEEMADAFAQYAADAVVTAYQRY